MVTMMIKFKYTPEAMKAIFLSGDDRKEAMRKMIEPLGGKFVCSYGMQGQYYHMMMIADQVGLGYGEFIHTLGDAHIYLNHQDQVNQQLNRITKKLPTVKINRDVQSIFDYEYNDFTLEDYNPDDHIKASVSV